MCSSDLINARYRGDEIAYLTGNADLVTIVTTGQVTEGLNFVERLLEGLPGIRASADAKALSLPETPRLRNVLVLGAGATDAPLVSEGDIAEAVAVFDGSEVTRRIDAVGDDDPAVILYTSGTTSKPKGCVLSGAAIVGNGRAQIGRAHV